MGNFIVILPVLPNSINGEISKGRLSLTKGIALTEPIKFQSVLQIRGTQV